MGHVDEGNVVLDGQVGKKGVILKYDIGAAFIGRHVVDDFAINEHSDGFGVAKKDETVRRPLGYTKHGRNLGHSRLAGDVWVWDE